MNDTTLPLRPKLDNIPPSLRKLSSNWINWKAKLRFDNDGVPVLNKFGRQKFDKIPVRPSDGANASVSDATGWGGLDASISRLDHDEGVCGVGLVSSGLRELTFVDADECVAPDGTLAPWATELVDKLGSYAELSPSGSGLRVIVEGNGVTKNATAHGDHWISQIEVYCDTRRFVTISGHALPASPSEVVANDAGLRWLRDEIAAHGGAQADTSGLPDKPQEPPPSGSVDWDEIQHALAKLDPNGLGYDEWLNVGCALHWADGGGARGLEVFSGWSSRSAKHDQGKTEKSYRSFGSYTGPLATVGTLLALAVKQGWDRGQYFSDTLDETLKALGGSKELAEAHITQEQTDKLLKIIVRAGRGSVLEGRGLRTMKASLGLMTGTTRDRLNQLRREYKPPKRTDASTHAEAAAMFLDLQRHELVGCQGDFWRGNPTTNLWERLTPDQMRVEIGQSPVDGQTVVKRSADYAAVAKELYGRIEQPLFFDGGPVGAIACGTKVYRFDPSYASGIRVDELALDQRQREKFSQYDIDLTRSPSLVWLPFLRKTFKGPDCDAQIALLQELMGLSMAGLMPRFKTAAILYGVTNSGKSVVLSVLRELTPPGLRVEAMSLDTLSRPDAVARLAGKRVVIGMESKSFSNLPEAALKALVGGDDFIEARRLYGASYSFKPTGGLWLPCNRLPSIDEGNRSFFDRWRALDFRWSVPPRLRDVNLPAKCAMVEGDAILAWAIAGAGRAVRDGLSDGVSERILWEWRAQENPVYGLLASDLVVFDRENSGLEATRGEIYAAFQSYCAVESIRVWSRRKVFSQLREIGLFEKKTNSERIFLGVRLTAEGRVKGGVYGGFGVGGSANFVQAS